MRTLLVVLMALMLAACGSVQAYEGPARSAEEVAVIVPDSPRARAADSPFGGGAGGGGMVQVRVGEASLRSFRSRFEVLPGTVPLVVVFRDTQTPVTGRMLQTRPVTFPIPVQAGRTYRIRGVVRYPPGTDNLRRSTDLQDYAVVLVAQDEESGQVVHQLRVPTDQLELVDA